MTKLSQLIVQTISNIPKGKVLTYGAVAAIAGSPRAARQVSWLLKTQTEKHNLPWHRVINSKGMISIKEFHGYSMQKHLLESEGVVFDKYDKVDLKLYLWDGQI